MHAWKEELDFRQLVLEDPESHGRVPRAKIERAFDLKRQLKNIDKIFARVFPNKTGSKEQLSSSKKKAVKPRKGALKK